MLRQLLLIAVLVVSVVGCKTHSKVPVAAGTKVLTDSLSMSPDSMQVLIRRAELDFSWFSARVGANTQVDQKSNSFTANLRIRKDSVIWLSISPALGIEVARVLITPDSLKFINRINGTYFKGDFRYLKSLLQTEVNFPMIQAVLLGNSYLHYSPESYLGENDSEGFVLSTLKKRKIKRETDLVIPEILTQEIWYSRGTGKVTRMEMQDYRPPRKFSVSYPLFDIVEGILLPKNLLVNANAEKLVKIELEYSKITLNKELNLPFGIPEHYEPMR